MNSMAPISSTARPPDLHCVPIAAGNAPSTDVAATGRVPRNTYALLSMTLLPSAAIAAASVAFQLSAPGILLTLGATFLALSAWALTTRRRDGRPAVGRPHPVRDTPHRSPPSSICA